MTPRIYRTNILISVTLKYLVMNIKFSSDQYSHSVMSDTLQSHGLQHTSLPCPSPTPRACSNSCPSCWWCHPIISSSVVPSHPAFNLSQHQGLFQWVSSLHQVAKRLEFQLQHQPYQWIFKTDFLRIDWLELLAAQGCSESSPTPQFKSINSSVLSFLYGPTLTSIHYYWKNHSLD